MAWTNPYAPYQNTTPAYTPTPFGGGTLSTGGASFSGYQTPVFQQPQQTTSLLTVFVNTEEEVRDYPVAAGTTVMLISFKLGKFYLKSTGTNGVPAPIREFTFKEEVAPNTINQNEPSSVSREEFDALSKKLDKLLNELGGGT